MSNNIAYSFVFISFAMTAFGMMIYACLSMVASYQYVQRLEKFLIPIFSKTALYPFKLCYNTIVIMIAVVLEVVWVSILLWSVVGIFIVIALKPRALVFPLMIEKYLIEF